MVRLEIVPEQALADAHGKAREARHTAVDGALERGGIDLPFHPGGEAVDGGILLLLQRGVENARTVELVPFAVGSAPSSFPPSARHRLGWLIVAQRRAHHKKNDGFPFLFYANMILYRQEDQSQAGDNDGKQAEPSAEKEEKRGREPAPRSADARAQGAAQRGRARDHDRGGAGASAPQSGGPRPADRANGRHGLRGIFARRHERRVDAAQGSSRQPSRHSLLPRRRLHQRQPRLRARARIQARARHGLRRAEL